MMIRSRALAQVCVGILGISLLGSLSASGQAQQQNAKKRDKAQQQEADALAKAVGAVQAGQPAPADMAVAIDGYHFFRAGNGQTYAVLTATVDGKSLPSPAIAMMLCVASRTAPTVASTADKKSAVVAADDQNDDRKKKDEAKSVVRPSFEDVYFTSLKPGEADQPSRLSRAFQVPPGEYDVYLAVKERNTGDKKQKPKLTVFRQPLTVPDFRGDEMTTSSLVVASKIDQLPAPLSEDEQRENPFTIGLLQVIPKVGTKFAKTDELGVYFNIYNEALDADKKPNIQIDFLFYRKQADGEKKIANSEPQVISAARLPPQFDVAKHQIFGCQTWPLTSFQPGDYRLEMKITDKVAGKSLTREVNFSVS